FHGQAAGHGQDTRLANRRRHYVTRPKFGISGGDVEDRDFALFFQPAAAAGHGAMDGSHQDNGNRGFESSWRKDFGAGDEVAGGIVDQYIERPFLPDAFDHGFYALGVADIADVGRHLAASRGAKL